MNISRSNFLLALGLIALAVGLGTQGVAIQSVHAATGGNGGCNSGPICSGDGGNDVKAGAKHKASELLRQTAQNTNNNPNISDPPKSEVVSKLNQKADQLDPNGGCDSCG